MSSAFPKDTIPQFTRPLSSYRPTSLKPIDVYQSASDARAGSEQTAHGRLISAQHRGLERGMAMVVFCFQIRAELDQQTQNVVAISADGEVQRRMPLFEARHAAVECFRAILYNLANQIQVSN